MDNQFKTTKTDRIFSIGCEFAQMALDIMGQRKTPDNDTAYMEFQIAQGLQLAPEGLLGVTAYGSCLHPAVVQASYKGMIDKLVNRGHELKANVADPEKRKNARDHIIGSVVGVEFPEQAALSVKPRQGGRNPIVRGVAALFKRADGVDRLLGEHLSGRHRHSVSMEVNYNLAESGFVVGNRANAKKKQEDLMAGLVQDPNEFSGTDYGYVPLKDAPDELLACYNLEKKMVDKKWDGLPVMLMKGGRAGGSVNFMGIGMVRYGAEREAEIQQLLASDPNALELLAEDGLITYTDAMAELLVNAKAVMAKLSEK